MELLRCDSLSQTFEDPPWCKALYCPSSIRSSSDREDHHKRILFHRSEALLIFVCLVLAGPSCVLYSGKFMRSPVPRDPGISIPASSRDFHSGEAPMFHFLRISLIFSLSWDFVGFSLVAYFSSLGLMFVGLAHYSNSSSYVERLSHSFHQLRTNNISYWLIEMCGVYTWIFTVPSKSKKVKIFLQQLHVNCASSNAKTCFMGFKRYITSNSSYVEIMRCLSLDSTSSFIENVILLSFSSFRDRHISSSWESFWTARINSRPNCDLSFQGHF